MRTPHLQGGGIDNDLAFEIVWHIAGDVFAVTGNDAGLLKYPGVFWFSLILFLPVG